MSPSPYWILGILLFFVQNSRSLIIPEEIPTLLSLIYSNIPPIKKGTDSRVGVGFRLGEHADFQVLVELGPQKETDPIGKEEEDNKRRRAIMLNAAMRGDLGPWARNVAKYQMEMKLKKELQRYKIYMEKLKAAQSVKNEENNKNQSNWLSTWNQELKESQDIKPKYTNLKDKKTPALRLKVVNDPKSNNLQSEMELLKAILAPEKNVSIAESN